MTGYAVAGNRLRQPCNGMIRARVRALRLIAFGALAVAVVAPIVNGFHRRPTIRVVDPCITPDGRRLLTIDGIRASRQEDMLVITGVATNRTRTTLADLTVNALCLDRHARAVDAQSALLGRRHLPAGARSGFKVILNDAGAAVDVELAFEPLTGDRTDPAS